MWFRRTFGSFLFSLMFAAAAAAAEPAWVKFETPAGARVAALLAVPDGAGPHPAAIYNHGTVVRRDGYSTATNKGYDLDGYVRALAAAGYVALAPVREHLTSADFETAVGGGVDTVRGAIEFLKGRNDVRADAIGAVGFSEGGLISLWAGIEGADLDALVLMSPATIREAGDRQLKRAARKDRLSRLKMPVLLTVGAQDNRSIRKLTAKRLIPNLESLGIGFEHRSDYPGDHKWFWTVRPAHFADVVRFLDTHLKN